MHRATPKIPANTGFEGLSMAARATVVDDPAEGEQALRLLMQKYPPQDALPLPMPTPADVRIFRVGTHRGRRAGLGRYGPIAAAAGHGDADVRDVAGVVVGLGDQHAVDDLARDVGMRVARQDHVDARHFIGQELCKVLFAAVAVGLVQAGVRRHNDHIRARIASVICVIRPSFWVAEKV